MSLCKFIVAKIKPLIFNVAKTMKKKVDYFQFDFADLQSLILAIQKEVYDCYYFCIYPSKLEWKSFHVIGSKNVGEKSGLEDFKATELKKSSNDRVIMRKWSIMRKWHFRMITPSFDNFSNSVREFEIETSKLSLIWVSRLPILLKSMPSGLELLFFIKKTFIFDNS